ncbi:hypothetical protein [Rivularia sp. UHCC 0363]|uniref:hypothetical protein n=1 Tax=Rivularia sp. UHCC 0363 TaxID=3110244 RepID=UPI002B201BD9|nr:hypothetical protein [Rivularia sp. UHCC 0363]MEA5596847.1 hypothetical protein [Rivularia sp. UHCC 0363]
MSLDFNENIVEETVSNVSTATFSTATKDLSSTNICLIEGEQAIAVNQLPQSWQDIYAANSNTKLSDPQAYVKMAQLFLHKMSNGDVDLFNESKSEHLKPAFCEIFGSLAWEALEFYGEDFKVEKYPDFDLIKKEILSEEDCDERKKILEIGKALFEEFGYDLPASFYHVHLAPIYREEVSEIRPLRFSEPDKNNARAWDASLHGQKVFPIQLTVQSISSKHGFFQEHGCGCNHAMTRVGATDTAFDYQIRPEMRTTWIRDFIWTIWYEYAFFKFTPVTRFLIG